jgi:hypothetical protein
VNLRPALDLFLYDEASANSQFNFEVAGKNGAMSGVLKRLAPGHFQALLPISAPGDYKIELTELRKDRRIALSTVSYSLPYNPNAELPRPGFNTALLAELAEASGGQINPPLDAIAPEPSVSHRTATRREPFIALAFFLFLLEVAFRKLVLQEAD